MNWEPNTLAAVFFPHLHRPTAIALVRILILGARQVSRGQQGRIRCRPVVGS